MPISSKLKHAFCGVKLLVTDFDGVMTDGFVYIDQNGLESVRCSRKDGFGIEMLRKAGIETVVLSKETNSVVAARCRKLNIRFWQGIDKSNDKLSILSRFAKESRIFLKDICYIGDDLNDLKIMSNVGLSISVADGHKLIKKNSDYITKSSGGCHAVREVAELILFSKKIDLKNLK